MYLALQRALYGPETSQRSDAQLLQFQQTAIQITVNTIDGSSLKFKLDQWSTISDVKAAIASSTLGIPKSFQKLCKEQSELEDDDEVFADDCYQLVVCMNSVQKLLKSCSREERLDVLHDLVLLGARGGKTALTIATTHLEDLDPCVRCAALEVIAQVGEKGDKHCITTLVKYLEEDDCRVRQVAREAIAQIAQRGDQYTVNRIVMQLEHPDLVIRSNAKDLLRRVCEPNDQHTIKEVTKRTDHDDAEIRCTALEALICVAGKGNENAVSAAIAHTSDRNIKVRETAVYVIGEIAEKADTCAIGALTRCLDDSSGLTHGVRRLALGALAKIAEKGDQDIIALVLARLGSGCGVPDAAWDAIGEVADRGNQQAISRILPFLKIDSRGGHAGDAKWSAIHAIAKIAEKGDDRVINALRLCDDSCDDFLRKAQEVLRQLI